MAKSFVAIEHDDEHVPTITLGQKQRRAQSQDDLAGQITDGGGAIPGGFSQLFNKVICSFAYARLPEAAKLIYPALVWMADHRRQFVIENRGYGEISKYAGVSRSTAQKGIAKLTEAGLIRLARAARRTRDGGLTANVYQLLVPIEGLEDDDAEPYRDAAHPRTVSQAAPVTGADTPLDRQAAHTSSDKRHVPVPRSGRPTKKVKKQSSKTVAKSGKSSAAAKVSKQVPAPKLTVANANLEAAEAWLVERGVGDPLLRRLLAEAEPEMIRQHVMDFDLRNGLKGGRTKTAGWLVQSILVPYALHEKTVAKLEAEQRSARSAAAGRRRQLVEDEEQARLERVEAWVEDQFDTMDDDELSAWHEKVMAEHPRIARGLADADPRTNARLGRLIKGALSELYAEA